MVFLFPPDLQFHFQIATSKQANSSKLLKSLLDHFCFLFLSQLFPLQSWQNLVAANRLEWKLQALHIPRDEKSLKASEQKQVQNMNCLSKNSNSVGGISRISFKLIRILSPGGWHWLPLLSEYLISLLSQCSSIIFASVSECQILSQLNLEESFNLSQNFLGLENP